MATARFAWGIDIGNRALKAVKLVRDGGRLRVDDFEIIEHEQVLSNAGDNRQSLIQTALANFVQRHQTKGGLVGVGVSGQSSFARFIKLPPVEPRKIPEIVRFEAIQQIPVPLEDVEWSYQLFQDPESPDVEVGIFAMRKELVGQQIKYFTDIDLNVQLVQMNPLAVYNAMYHDDRLKGTTMIVDLGAENTDLVIADGETVWLRSIPIGGNNFTEALVKAFKLNFQKAEELKRNAKTSKYARQIFQAMRPVFADLVAEIQRSIGFYASVHRDSRIGRILGLGGTFRLPGLQKYLQQNLQLDVEYINGFTAGAPDDGKLATSFNENLLSLPAAYGLALQVLGEGKIGSSLLPESIRRAKEWQEKTKWFGAAAALFALGTGIAYGSLMFSDIAGQSNDAKTDSAAVQKVLNQARQLDSRWSEVENSGSADRQRIVNVESLAAYRQVWPNLLTDIYSVLPAPPPVDADVKALTATPRGARNLIFIDSISSRYVADMTTVLGQSDAEFKKLADGGVLPSAGGGNPGGGYGGGYPSGAYGGGPGGPGGYPGGPGGGRYPGGPGYGGPSTPATPAVAGEGGATPRGYLLTLECVTPNNAGVELVDRQVVAGLDALKADKTFGNRPYYIAKVNIVSGNRLSGDTARMQALLTAYQSAKTGQAPAGGTGGYNPGNSGYPGTTPGYPGAGYPGNSGYPGANSGYPGGNGGNTPGAAADPDAPYRDRVTNEDVRNDWVVRVLVAVVLDPPKPAPAGETPGQ